jgi:hypothetical protein
MLVRRRRRQRLAGHSRRRDGLQWDGRDGLLLRDTVKVSQRCRGRVGERQRLLLLLLLLVVVMVVMVLRL